MDIFIYDTMERFYTMNTHRDELSELEYVYDLSFGNGCKIMIPKNGMKYDEYLTELTDFNLEFDNENNMLSIKFPRFRFFKKTVYQKVIRRVFVSQKIKKANVCGKKLYNPVTGVLHMVLFSKS